MKYIFILFLSIMLSNAYADGCKFWLCIAGPWSSIKECVPTVLYYFKRFKTPSCSHAQGSLAITNLSEKTCPLIYKKYGYVLRNDPYYAYYQYIGCQFQNRTVVKSKSGDLWSEVFWNKDGNISIKYSSLAKSRGLNDSRYDADYALWVKNPPKKMPPRKRINLHNKIHTGSK